MILTSISAYTQHTYVEHAFRKWKRGIQYYGTDLCDRHLWATLLIRPTETDAGGVLTNFFIIKVISDFSLLSDICTHGIKRFFRLLKLLRKTRYVFQCISSVNVNKKIRLLSSFRLFYLLLDNFFPRHRNAPLAKKKKKKWRPLMFLLLKTNVSFKTN